MISEQQQEQAALFALGILGEEESQRFTVELRQNGELRELLLSLQRTVEKNLVPAAIHNPSPSVKEKLLLRIRGRLAEASQASHEQPARVTTGLALAQLLHRAPLCVAWARRYAPEASRLRVGTALCCWGRRRPGGRNRI